MHLYNIYKYVPGNLRSVARLQKKLRIIILGTAFVYINQAHSQVRGSGITPSDRIFQFLFF